MASDSARDASPVELQPVRHSISSTRSGLRRRRQAQSSTDDDDNGGVADAIVYDTPDVYDRLSEVISPEPVENPSEGSLYHHHDLESNERTEQLRVRSHESIRRHRTHSSGGSHSLRRPSTDGSTRRHSIMSQRSRQQPPAAATTAAPTPPREEEEEQYDVPDRYGVLNEVSAPPPIENPDESTLYRHHSIEDRAPPPDRLARRPSGTATIRRRARRARRTARISAFLTQLFTVSYLVFFSLFGTLARLGLNGLTDYTGAPVTFGVLWSNFTGTVVMGFLAELSPLIHRHLAPQDDEMAVEENLEEEKEEPAASSSGAADSGGTTSGPEDQEGDANDGTDNNKDEDDDDSEPSPPPAPPRTWKRRPIPLYIGMSTGFCGSFTSFSSYILDIFLAMSNALDAPRYHDGEIGSAPASRPVGRDVLALLAVALLTIGMCLSALKLGAHIAIALSHTGIGLSAHTTRRLQPWFDRGALILGPGCWLGAVFMAIWPPHNFWRGDVLFSLVFAPLGCLLRFYLSLLLNGVWSSFPLGTFTVNMSGTIILAMAWDLQHVPPPASLSRISLAGCQVLQGIMDGFCGCLTTVSTWMTELTGLRRTHAYIYGLTSVVSGVCLMVLILGSMKWSIGWQQPICSN